LKSHKSKGNKSLLRLEVKYRERGLSQEQLAEDLGVSSRTLRRYKKGDTQASSDFVSKVGFKLGAESRRKTESFSGTFKKAISGLQKDFSNKQIAEVLGISESTFYSYKRKEKLGQVKLKNSIPLKILVDGKIKVDLTKKDKLRREVAKIYRTGGDLYHYKPIRTAFLFGGDLQDNPEKGLVDAVNAKKDIVITLRFFNPINGRVRFRTYRISGYDNMNDFWKVLYQHTRTFLAGRDGSDWSVTIEN
jgi:transcriptional regulator with XRE-family HTH domain